MFNEEDDNKTVNPRSLLIYKKGEEIMEITHRIIELIPDDSDEILKSHKGFMLEDAAMLTVKIAGAEGGDLYDLRMEAAAIIRKSARDLLLHCTGLETFGFKDTQYLVLIRKAIEEYRLLFIDWVKSFDQWNYIIDRWGLFNPPGVGPFDKDPDDDIPWNFDDEEDW